MIRIKASMLGALLVLVTLAPAQAGGWWSFVGASKSLVTAGDEVTIDMDSAFAGEQDRRDTLSGQPPYFAYLLQGTDRQMVETAMGEGDPGDWWSPPPIQHQLALVRFQVPPDGIYRASAVVTIPEVTPGKYEVMFCTDGCVDPLGSAVPTSIKVVETSALPLIRDLRRAKHKKNDFRHQAIVSRERIRELASQLDAQKFRRRSVEVRLASAERRVDQLEAGAETDGVSWGWLLVPPALAVLPLGVFALRRRRVAPMSS